MRQGEIYWLDLKGLGSEPSGRRPVVVVQHDRFNRSAIQTTVVAAITSNIRLGQAPGNIRLRKGEANLPRASVINISQLRTIDRSRLTEHVGNLSAKRLRQVIDGLDLIFGFSPSPTSGP